MDKHISKHPATQHLAEDVIHFREYKILLHPERFTSKRGFLEFWEFMWRERSELWRFLRWTGEMERWVHHKTKSP